MTQRGPGEKDVTPARSALPFVMMPVWVEAATSCGFDLQPILAKVGIEVDLLHLESSPIEQFKIGALMSECVAATRKGHFPLALGQSFELMYLPELKTLLQSSGSLRDALQIFEWVRRLINPRWTVRLEERGELAWIIGEFLDGDIDPRVASYFVESMFSAATRAGNVRFRRDDWCRHIWFRHSALRDEPTYREYLPIAPEFSRPTNALAVSRELLDAHFAGAWPELYRQAHLRLVDRYVEGARPSGVSARVERAFSDDPALIEKGIEDVSDRVGLNVRTLQRRLRQEGEGFAALRSRARMQVASTLLKDPALAIDDVSTRLGFSDRRAFTRAFTRWIGMTPSEFRRKST